jgi:hypothetical protein
MEAQQDVAQARVDAKTRVQEAEATKAVTLVNAGLNFVQEKDSYCMLDLDDEAALTALQEAVALPFLIRARISVLLTPHWASALAQHPPEECSLDLVDRTMQSLAFMSSGATL